MPVYTAACFIPGSNGRYWNMDHISRIDPPVKYPGGRWRVEIFVTNGGPPQPFAEVFDSEKEARKFYRLITEDK